MTTIHYIQQPRQPRHSKGVAVVLCLLLGGIGMHHWYLGNYIRGILYLLFFWTLIPAILSFIDLAIIIFSDFD